MFCCSTCTLSFLGRSHFTECRVEKHTALPSEYVGMWVGRFFAAEYTALPSTLPLHSCYIPPHSRLVSWLPMISPVWTFPVHDRAQYCPVLLAGRTGLDLRVPVLHWTGSVWTSSWSWRGGKIHRSPPWWHTLTGGSRRGQSGNAAIMEMHWAMESADSA